MAAQPLGLDCTMGSLGSNEERMVLITRRIPEENVYGLGLIRDALAVEDRSLRCLWCMINPCFGLQSFDFDVDDSDFAHWET